MNKTPKNKTQIPCKCEKCKTQIKNLSKRIAALENKKTKERYDPDIVWNNAKSCNTLIIVKQRKEKFRKLLLIHCENNGENIKNYNEIPLSNLYQKSNIQNCQLCLEFYSWKCKNCQQGSEKLCSFHSNHFQITLNKYHPTYEIQKEQIKQFAKICSKCKYKQEKICPDHLDHLKSLSPKIDSLDFWPGDFEEFVRFYESITKEHKPHKSCAICGCCLIYKNKWTKNNNVFNAWNVDHILPTEKKGWNDYDNLQLACYRCNEIKGGRCLHTDDKIEYKEIKVFLINTEIKTLILFKCQLCFTIIHSSSKNYESLINP